MIAVNPDRTRCPYEVGDILQTINSTPPAQRWPGTQWQQITDRFVRGSDAQHPAGSTGGSWTHTQTIDELVSHAHSSSDFPGYDSGGEWVGASGTAAPQTRRTTYVGGGQPMDITNPYYSAYIWLRTG